MDTIDEGMNLLSEIEDYVSTDVEGNEKPALVNKAQKMEEMKQITSEDELRTSVYGFYKGQLNSIQQQFNKVNEQDDIKRNA